MEMLLILTYAAICIVIFKVFRIPLNKWTVPTAVLGGAIMIGGIVLLMNYNHPYTKVARTMAFTTPIVPLVKGRVIEVPIKSNTLVKKGDVLFKIDPVPFQARVDEQEAALAKAKQDLQIAEQQWQQTQANVKRAEADRDRAKDKYDRYAKANAGPTKPFSEAQVEAVRETYLSAEARVEAAKAAERAASVAFNAQFEGEKTVVALAKARLERAQYDLEQTTVYAPTDGLVTQLILHPGQVTVPLPLAPVMVFVHAEEPKMVASFFQNYALRLEPGAEAEVIFSALPGQIFKAEIESVQPILAEGAVQASGKLISANKPAYDRFNHGAQAEGRPVRTQAACGHGRRSCRLHASCSSRGADAEDPVSDEKLAELHLWRGPLGKRRIPVSFRPKPWPHRARLW